MAALTGSSFRRELISGQSEMIRNLLAARVHVLRVRSLTCRGDVGFVQQAPLRIPLGQIVRHAVRVATCLPVLQTALDV